MTKASRYGAGQDARKVNLSFGSDKNGVNGFGIGPMRKSLGNEYFSRESETGPIVFNPKLIPLE